MKQRYCPDCQYYGDQMPYGGSCAFLSHDAGQQGNGTMQIWVNGKNIANDKPIILVGSAFGCCNFVEKDR